MTSVLLGGVMPPVSADGRARTIKLQDRCDPATFNAALGPSSCDPAHKGRVTFESFVAGLTKNPARVLAKQNYKGWRFDEDRITISAGRDLVATNTGGEAHTFTQVPAFGGGCVDQLNAPFGLSNPGPAVCGAAFGTSLVLPGASLHVSHLVAGRTYRFECLIHPWMRATVRVRTVDKD